MMSHQGPQILMTLAENIGNNETANVTGTITTPTKDLMDALNGATSPAANAKQTRITLPSSEKAQQTNNPSNMYPNNNLDEELIIVLQKIGRDINKMTVNSKTKKIKDKHIKDLSSNNKVRAMMFAIILVSELRGYSDGSQ